MLIRKKPLKMVSLPTIFTRKLETIYMSKYYLSIFFLLIIPAWLTSQKTYVSTKDSDAKAISALNKIKSKYTAANQQITSTFSLKMEFPGQSTRLEKGTMIQSGNKFNLDLKEMGIINDGKSIWFINKKQKEVQINDYSKDSNQGIVNPVEFMNNYNPKSYISRIVTDDPNSGKQMDVIEIKPVNRKTEFSKARITLGKVSGELVKMELFNKDGSRHTLTISKTSFSKTINSGAFTFNKTKFPGYHVEDLRIN